jgi:dihydrofolate reductase
MRTLTAHYFISLDGVVDSPHEWHFRYADQQVQDVVAAGTDGVDALLMGRRTYEEWAAFWPGQSGYPLADFINGTQKYVVSTSLERLGWERCTLIDGGVVPAVTALKSQDGGRIAVNGSGTLLSTLLGAGLVDELHLLVHPVVVGRGKHLFEGGDGPVDLALADQRVFPSGVTLQTYRPATPAEAAA